MRPINNAVDELFQPRELAEDEYLNEADGLMYCSKCHTPRQHRIELKERVFLPTVRCRCQQEIYDNSQPYTKDTTQENWNPWELFLTAAN